MSPLRLTLFPLLLLAIATTASAQHTPTYRPAPVASSTELDQTIYKGLVGNVLDAIPMDPSKRVGLQRANAVISNTASGRTLAVLVGLSNPVLMVVGLVWGAWAASNIKSIEADMKLTVDSAPSGGSAVTQAPLFALEVPAPALDDAPGNSGYAPVLVSSNFIGNAGDDAYIHPPVIKIWLPQRSSTLSQ